MAETFSVAYMIIDYIASLPLLFLIALLMLERECIALKKLKNNTFKKVKNNTLYI